MCVEPVAAVVCSDADSPSRIEEPPRLFDDAGRDGPHGRAGLGKDVVALVEPDLTPPPVHEAPSGGVPVVVEVYDRVPLGTSHRKDSGAWLRIHVSTGGSDLGPRRPEPGKGQGQGGQRQDSS